MTGAFLHPFARPAATDYLTIARGEGAAIFDDAGRRYVDALAGLWYCQIGHGRADMATAIADQIRTLECFQCFEPFTNEPAERLAQELAQRAPMPDARVFFTSSGSEAVDSALKLVRLTMRQRGERDRRVIVAREHGYHGVTLGGTSLQGIPINREGFEPLLDGVIHVAHDDISEVAGAFEQHGERIAAVIAEPVIAAGGVRPPPEGHLAELRRLCDEHGALLVLDEVVSGFGRLGSWWGADRYGIEPDLVTFAKGVTSGYVPLGGVLVGRAVREALEEDDRFVLRHGHTYSGHPTACAAALENLRIIEAEGLLRRAEIIGERLGPALSALASGNRGIVDVRGEVAIWAVELEGGLDAIALRDQMMSRGVLPRALGTSAVAFCPPLVIAESDLDRCIDALAESLDALLA